MKSSNRLFSIGRLGVLCLVFTFFCSCYSLSIGYSTSKRMEHIYRAGEHRNDMGIVVYHSSMRFSHREQDSLVARIAGDNNFYFRSLKSLHNPVWYFERNDLAIFISDEEYDRLIVELTKDESVYNATERNEKVDQPYAILHKSHELLPWVIIIPERGFDPESLEVAIRWALLKIDQCTDFPTHLLDF